MSKPISSTVPEIITPMSSFPGFGHISPSTSSKPAQWYRFEIDCAACPDGVNIHDMMMAADGRKKRHRRHKRTHTRAGDRRESSSSSLAVGDASGANSEGKIHTSSSSPAVTTSEKDAVAVSPEQASAPRGSEKEGQGSSDGTETKSDDANNVEVSPDKANHDSARNNEGAQHPSEPSAGPKASGQPEHLAARHRPREPGALFSLVDLLESKYGGGGAGMWWSSGENSMDEDSYESSSDDAKDLGEGGTDGDSVSVNKEKKRRKKKKKKKKKRDMAGDLDYDDDFVDDSELVEQYMAREAARKEKTVHSGFYANKGRVDTVGSSKSSRGGGQSSKSGGAGEANLLVTKKKKAKTTTSSDGGSKTTPPIKKKLKRPLSADGQAAKKPAKLKTSAKAVPAASPIAAAAAAVTGAAVSAKISQQVVSNSAGGQQSRPSNAGAAIISSTTSSKEGGLSTMLTSGVTDGATVAGDSAVNAKGAPSADGTGIVAAVQKSATSTDQIDVMDMDDVTVDVTGSTPAKGEGEKTEKAEGKTIWEPSAMAEAALSQFEQESKAWVDDGRPEGDAATAVLVKMRHADFAVRTSMPDAHNARPYVERLSAVCGCDTNDMKTILTDLKNEEDRQQAARLKEEVDQLRSSFAQQVAASLKEQATNGEPLKPPFIWSIPLRELLHDLLRAFEAWVSKEYGGLRKGTAVQEIKNHYDELAREWPPNLEVTPEEMRKMFMREKRRVSKAKSKANKDPTGESTLAATSHTSSETPGSRESKAAAVDTADNVSNVTTAPAHTAPHSPLTSTNVGNGIPTETATSSVSSGVVSPIRVPVSRQSASTPSAVKPDLAQTMQTASSGSSAHPIMLTSESVETERHPATTAIRENMTRADEANNGSVRLESLPPMGTKFDRPPLFEDDAFIPL